MVRMDEDAPVRRVFDRGICERRRRGPTRSCQKDQVEEALSSIGVANAKASKKQKRKTIARLLMTLECAKYLH